MAAAAAAVDAATLDAVRSGMRGLRPPAHYDKVYKDECMYSFDTPESPGGLYVNLKTYQVRVRIRCARLLCDAGRARAADFAATCRVLPPLTHSLLSDAAVLSVSISRNNKYRALAPTTWSSTTSALATASTCTCCGRGYEGCFWELG